MEKPGLSVRCGCGFITNYIFLKKPSLQFLYGRFFYLWVFTFSSGFAFHAAFSLAGIAFTHEAGNGNASAVLCSAKALQQLKHGFRQPAFW